MVFCTGAREFTRELSHTICPSSKSSESEVLTISVRKAIWMLPKSQSHHNFNHHADSSQHPPSRHLKQPQIKILTTTTINSNFTKLLTKFMTRSSRTKTKFYFNKSVSKSAQNESCVPVCPLNLWTVSERTKTKIATVMILT